MSQSVLIITPFFSPNIGGVETHLDDLVDALDKNGYKVYVQTYSPLTTDSEAWKAKEKKGKNIFIRRYWWFGKDLFHKIEKYPFIDFLYITPYLLVRVFFFMLFNHKKIEIIHAQGFNASFIGVVLKKFFSFRLIASTHAIYELDKESKTVKLVKLILDKCDKVLCLSDSSKAELVGFGMSNSKLDRFRYWIDLNYFKSKDKVLTREKHNLRNKFTVLFVGRLIDKKGINILISVAKILKNIQFVFIGVGPLESTLKEADKHNENIIFLGKKENKELVDFYNIADIFCIPSQYEEGFGRVVIEAVSCGIPVVGSNKGGIKEALNGNTSILVNPTVNNIKESIKALYNDREQLLQLSENCVLYSKKSFSEENVNDVIKHY